MIFMNVCMYVCLYVCMYECYVNRCFRCLVNLLPVR